MSFITQCPSCETQFKVAPDQLNISEGWVRCGQCQHVFDASLNLQPWWPEPETPEAPEPTAASDPYGQENPAPLEEGQVPPGSDALQEPRFDMLTAASAPSHGDEDGAREPLFEEPLEQFPQQRPSEPFMPPVPEAAGPVDGLQDRAVAPQEPNEPRSVDKPLPSFIKRAMEKAYWHQTSVRLTLYALIAVLLVVLGAQWFYRHKDDWAANHANLRPVLHGVCVVLRCQVNLPRKLSEVVIDSSSFVRRESNRFAFQLMLRNRAEVEVAMPTLELTLTDIENQVIARRIIPPADWPDQPTTLAVQGEWPLQLELLLDVPPTQIVTGYQAELFYP
jgi:predicted Zn finger-like uncharacterized protein